MQGGADGSVDPQVDAGGDAPVDADELSLRVEGVVGDGGDDPGGVVARLGVVGDGDGERDDPGFASFDLDGLVFPGDFDPGAGEGGFFVGGQESEGAVGGVERVRPVDGEGHRLFAVVGDGYPVFNGLAGFDVVDEVAAAEFAVFVGGGHRPAEVLFSACCRGGRAVVVRARVGECRGRCGQGVQQEADHAEARDPG